MNATILVLHEEWEVFCFTSRMTKLEAMQKSARKCKTSSLREILLV